MPDEVVTSEVVAAPEVVAAEVQSQDGTDPAKGPDGKNLSHASRKADIHARLLEEEAAHEKAALDAESPARPEDGKEKTKAEGKSEDKKPETADSRAFAALARQKTEVRALEQRVAQEKSAAQALVQEAQSKLALAETRAKEAEAQVQSILKDPKAFFDYAMEHLGLKDENDFRAYARGAWKKPEKTESKEKFLTEADLKRAIEEDRQKLTYSQAADATIQKFQSITADEKYEAINLIYSPQERRQVADELVNKLNAIGKVPMKPGKQWNGQMGMVADLDAIADAVEEYAREDERYKKIVARLKPAEKKVDPKAGARAKVEPAPVVKQEPKSATNGARAMSHRERLAATFEAARRAGN